LSTIEMFVNSKADHGLVPLEAGRVYAPVLCTTWAATGDTGPGIGYITAIIGGTTALVNEVGDVPSARIPVRGSAMELLSVRTGSVG
jgi:hypothetical protein